MSSFGSLSNGEERSVGVRPFLRLAQSASVEEVLEDFTKIAEEKGIELCSVGFTRARLEREYTLPGAGVNARRVFAIDVRVDGGLTRFVVKFYESANPWVRADLEFAANLAALRIELLAGNRLRLERAGKGSDEASIIEELVGHSELIQRLGRWILAAGSVNSTVLITGESGTGKEVVAHAIHAHSGRAARPFVVVNCAALPENLIESELFGHERGAFTGADRQRIGRFEMAEGGTVFLDEIGELPLAMQPKLLRVLQDQTLERVGGGRTIKVNVRIIAATNRDLLREVQEHRFRHDLYFRLNVLNLKTPALREHPADIPLLVDHVLNKIKKRLGFKFQPEIEEEAMELLCRYQWPGNVRELEAMLERMAAETGDGYGITTAQVRSETGLEQTILPGEIEYRGVVGIGESLDDHLLRQKLEIYKIVRDRCGGSHSQAARRLGIGRTALYNELERARRRITHH